MSTDHNGNVINVVVQILSDAVNENKELSKRIQKALWFSRQESSDSFPRGTPGQWDGDPVAWRHGREVALIAASYSLHINTTKIADKITTPRVP